MTCDHCNGAEIDGRVCAFCLGGDSCEAAPTEEMLAAKAEMEAGGNTLHSFCHDCRSPIAACDMEDCSDEAFKWLETTDPKRTTFYLCEEHGSFAEELYEAQAIGEIALYQPGPEGCICDYPY